MINSVHYVGNNNKLNTVIARLFFVGTNLMDDEDGDGSDHVLVK